MNWLMKRGSFIIGLILLVLSFYFFPNIWVYIIISAIISIIGRSLVGRLIRIKIGKWNLSKGLAAGITLVLFWSSIALFLSTFLPLVVHEAQELGKIDVDAIQTHFAEPVGRIQKQVDDFGIVEEDFSVVEYLKEKLISVLNMEQVRDIFSNIASVLGNLFIAIFSISFMSFFFLKDDKLLLEGVLSFSEKGKESEVSLALHKIIKLLSRYFVGLVIEVSAIITLVTSGLCIVGIPFTHSIVIGLTAGFFNVIPYVGPLIGTLFGTIIASATLLTHGVPDNLFWLVISILSVFLIAQLLDNFLLQPLIYSNSVNASPLEIFIVILMAGTVWGIPGLVIAIPIYTVFRVVAKETFSQITVIDKITKNI